MFHVGNNLLYLSYDKKKIVEAWDGQEFHHILGPADKISLSGSTSYISETRMIAAHEDVALLHFKTTDSKETQGLAIFDGKKLTPLAVTNHSLPGMPGITVKNVPTPLTSGLPTHTVPSSSRGLLLEAM